MIMDHGSAKKGGGIFFRGVFGALAAYKKRLKLLGVSGLLLLLLLLLLD